MTDWTDTHKDFGKKDYWHWNKDKNYQQLWEEAGLTYQDAQGWIVAGFKPADYYSVKGWKNQGFTPQETKSWMDIGLTPWEYNVASYLKQNNHQPNLTETQLNQLKNEHNQNWLNTNYPQAETKAIKIDGLSSEGKQFSGSLIIANYLQLKAIDLNFQILHNLQINNCPQLKELNVGHSLLTILDLTNLPNLEKLDLSHNSLTNLNLADHQKLKKLNIWNNNLTNLDLSNNLSLEELYISNNNFNQDLSFLKDLVNLKELYLGNNDKERIKQGIYNKFTGSLEPLKNLSKLETLWIYGTDLDSGLEHLPDSLEKISCSVSLEDKDWRAKKIVEQLKDYKEDDYRGDYYSYKFWKIINHELKEKNQLKNQLQELERKLTNKNLAGSNQNLIENSEKLNKVIEQLQQKEKEVNKKLKELNQENKSLADQLAQLNQKKPEPNQNLIKELKETKEKLQGVQEQNSQLIENYTNLENAYQNLTEILNQREQKLEISEKKRETLEEKLRELENQPRISDYCEGCEGGVRKQKTRMEELETERENKTPHQTLKKILTKLQEHIQETENRMGLNEQVAQTQQNYPPKK